MDGRALGRGLRKRCPVCGSGELFTSFFTMRERCPGCGLTFEREEGYWLGAMVVAMTVVIVLFAAVFVGGMLVTWPDVPWNTLLVVTVILNGVVPVLLYPWFKTVWMGLHHAIVTSDRDETDRPI